MIQDSEFSPFRDFSLGVQEWRAQSEHDGSSRKLAWDPRTAVFDRSAADTDEVTNFFFLEFTLGMLMIGSLEERSAEELNGLCSL
jgi:hypothetical protein